jgi:hypothetical protein
MFRANVLVYSALRIRNKKKIVHSQRKDNFMRLCQTKTKHMKKILFSLSFIFMTILAFAQNPIITQNTSGPALCDGSAMLDSSFVATNEVWMGGGAILQSGGNSISGLCAGTYSVTFTTLGGNSVTINFTIGSGTFDPCANFTTTAAATDATSAMMCDGSMTVTVTGGSAPYSYTWSNAVTTGPTLTGLCPATYTVCVTDVNGCYSCIDAVVADDSTPIDSVLVFSNNSFPNGTIADSLNVTLITDCGFTYADADSAAITNFYTTSSDSIAAVWTVWGNAGTVLAQYTVAYGITNPVNGGIYSATLILFCGQKANGVNTIVINDRVQYSSVGINELNTAGWAVVNPFGTSLNVDFGQELSGNASLIDMAGRAVNTATLEQTVSMTMNTETVLSGTYFLVINSTKGMMTMKVIK